MNDYVDIFYQTMLSTMGDILPILTIIFAFQYLVIRRPVVNLKQVMVGFVFVLLGLTLFLVGLEKALFPLGELMAKQLIDPLFISGGKSTTASGHWSDYLWVLAFGACLGFAATQAEPALIAVAIKANEISGGSISVRGLRVTVGIGAAMGVAMGVFRIVMGIPLQYIIIGAYIVVIIQTFFSPKLIIALAYDSGGVTTSTVTVPVVTALGLGLASGIPGRSPLIDGFGMIATTCLFPIIAVLAYAQLSHWLAMRQQNT